MSSEIELPWDAADAAATFELGTVVADPLPVARGAMGRIWRLETSRGIWAVKHLFEAQRPEDVDREVRFVQRARDAGLAAPAVVATAAGEFLAFVAGSRGAVPLRVYEWIDSERALRSPVAADDAARAGEALAVMHGAGEVTDEEPDDWYRRRCIGGTWRSTEAKLRGSGEHGQADALSDAMHEVRALERLIVDERTPRLICHRDFEPENVLVSRGDRFVIVDWENAGPLDPSAEIAYSLLSWTMDAGGECSATSTRAFFDGYASRRPVPFPSGPAVFSVAVVTHLNYINVLTDIVSDRSASIHDTERARLVLMRVLLALPRSSVLELLLVRWRECARTS